MRTPLPFLAIGILASWLSVDEAGADETRAIIHQGVQRIVHLHFPPAPARRPLPLVIALHGSDQDHDLLEAWLGLNAVADREGFAGAYPRAWEGQWLYGEGINRLPQPRIGSDTVDDLGFLRKLIDELVGSGIADPRRVYMTGVSRGGFLAFTATCAMADRLAAVAPLLATMDTHQREGCAPARLLPIVVVAGTADARVPYDGWLGTAGRLLSVPETMEFWRSLHGCSRQSFALVPRSSGANATRIGIVDWLDCRTGATVRLYRVEGGGHQIPSRASISDPSRRGFGPRNADLETAEALWSLFSGVVNDSVAD